MMVSVGRKWNNPEIYHTVNQQGIDLSIKLEDFIEALKTEMGSVTWTVTKAQFSQQVDDAVRQVILDIKMESVKQ